jgi:hypothetical protein
MASNTNINVDPKPVTGVPVVAGANRDVSFNPADPAKPAGSKDPLINNKLKEDIQYLLDDTEWMEEPPKLDNDTDKAKPKPTNAEPFKFLTSEKPTQPPASTGAAPPQMPRPIPPNGSVPMLGYKGYRSDPLGFFMIDGKVVEAVDMDLEGEPIK